MSGRAFPGMGACWAVALQYAAPCGFDGSGGAVGLARIVRRAPSRVRFPVQEATRF